MADRTNSGTLLNVSTKFLKLYNFNMKKLQHIVLKLSCPVNSKKNSPGMGHLPIQQVLHVGHLNSFLELGVGNVTAKNQKIQMSGGLPGGVGEGMLRLQIDRCITAAILA